MIRKTRSIQKGEVRWWWWLLMTATVAAAFLVGQRFQTVERVGPSAPGLISPPWFFVYAPDTQATELVWWHTEINASYRASMQFVVCILNAGQSCTKTGTALHHWVLDAADLQSEPTAPGQAALRFTWPIPAGTVIPFEPTGHELRWTAVACWPDSVPVPSFSSRCTEAVPAEFSIAGVNLVAASPTTTFARTVGSDPPSGPMSVTVRGINDSGHDSGTFKYKTQTTLVAIQPDGTLITDPNHAMFGGSARYLKIDGTVIPASGLFDSSRFVGILMPGPEETARSQGMANLASTASGVLQTIAYLPDMMLTAPVGVAVFLWLDPDNERKETNETDNFSVQVENAR